MQIAPDAYKALYGVEQYVRASSVDKKILELMKLRASYINGCAYCVDMHTKDARLAGETEQRIYAVPVWRETPFFSDRERAALEWAETLTQISKAGVPDSVYERVRAQFSEKEIVDLTMAVIAINAWNRAAISFGTVPGSYQPPAHNQGASKASSAPK